MRRAFSLCRHAQTFQAFPFQLSKGTQHFEQGNDPALKCIMLKKKKKEVLPVHPSRYSYMLQLQTVVIKCLNPTYLTEKASLTLCKNCLSIIQSKCSITTLPAVVVFSSIWHCSSLALVSSNSCCRAHEAATRFDRRKPCCSESFCIASKFSNFCFAACRAAWSSSIFSSRSLKQI